jgi:hypothetical protein
VPDSQAAHTCSHNSCWRRGSWRQGLYATNPTAMSMWMEPRRRREVFSPDRRAVSARNVRDLLKGPEAKRVTPAHMTLPRYLFRLMCRRRWGRTPEALPTLA